VAASPTSRSSAATNGGGSACGKTGTPALRGAGIAHRRIYDLPHTYATWSLAAGVDLFTLSRRMGTSLAMIDATYGHLTPDADERERVLLDAYDNRDDQGAVSRR
jgi:integrase